MAICDHHISSKGLKAGILKSNLKFWELLNLLTTQYQRDWHSYEDELSKDHFMGYVARYSRRPSIAQHRIEDIGAVVKFWTKDTQSGKTVLDSLPIDEFIRALSDQTPQKYQNTIRYYGALAPRARNRSSALIFARLGEKRRPRPRRLRWAESIKRYFGRDPLIDSLGRRMEFIGRCCLALPKQ
jgi:hypothetical protein